MLAVFLDAPHILEPGDLPFELKAYDGDTGVEVRGWWKVKQDRSNYQGLEDTLRYLRDFLWEEVQGKGPFEVRCQL